MRGWKTKYVDDFTSTNAAEASSFVLSKLNLKELLLQILSTLEKAPPPVTLRSFSFSISTSRSDDAFIAAIIAL